MRHQRTRQLLARFRTERGRAAGLRHSSTKTPEPRRRIPSGC